MKHLVQNVDEVFFYDRIKKAENGRDLFSARVFLSPCEAGYHKKTPHPHFGRGVSLLNGSYEIFTIFTSISPPGV